jgi:excisionase family DNA binding protein
MESAESTPKRGMGQLFVDLTAGATQMAHDIGAAEVSVDFVFLAFLRHASQFGYFSYGPVTIDVRLVEEIVERTAPRGSDSALGMSQDQARFSDVLLRELRTSGRGQLDELHYLLAFMRVGEGLPARVFGELGVTPEQVERYSRDIRNPQPGDEKLYSPESAAEYLDVHVQTVRSWIRSGRLPASRLAGKRALRIRASDLQSVLEPVDPGTLDSQ